MLFRFNIITLRQKSIFFPQLYLGEKKVTFGWYEDDYVRFVLDQHAELEF
jgi:hypothetical protein